ncbi:MAG: sigma-54-dependent Fis family transcriptional regulator [Calditrichaeota bacterium]|nr:sigma-54-dependent Fis family transcriptional regulator [Calditrichota bacterium]
MSNGNRLLLIDDDINLCKVIGYQLEKQGFQVSIAHSGKEGLKLFESRQFDIVLTDVQMPDLSGIDVLKKIREKNDQVIVIIITAYGSLDSAIKACQLGADDYLTKPFSQEQLRFVIGKAQRLRELQQENIQLKEELIDQHGFNNLISRSPKMEAVLKMAVRVAASDATVLILGESGTGKELLARAIHYNSPRRDKPLITVNCPSIPDNLLESELFGHVKGAFTGAIKDRKGKFEMANGGTIFLDEIGDLKFDLQAKLLRVLQEQEFEPVGSSEKIHVDVRIIAATNKDLEQLVREGRFREDLYYRLSVFPITIPPLRERKEEIPVLFEHFLKKHGQGQTFRVEPEVLDTLMRYHWPGNVRELENVAERAVILAQDNRITMDCLPPSLTRQEKTTTLSGDALLQEEDLSLENIERKVIEEALRRAGGNRSKAARLLNIPRHVLLYRLKKLGME